MDCLNNVKRSRHFRYTVGKMIVQTRAFGRLSQLRQMHGFNDMQLRPNKPPQAWRSMAKRQPLLEKNYPGRKASANISASGYSKIPG